MYTYIMSSRDSFCQKSVTSGFLRRRKANTTTIAMKQRGRFISGRVFLEVNDDKIEINDLQNSLLHHMSN